VLARSIFNLSINYRSVILYGSGRFVTDRDEKMDALYRFGEKLLPGGWDSVRPMNEQEFKATAVVANDIEDAVAKIRTGPPVDDEEDLSYPTWAGVIPMPTTFTVPIPDAHTPSDMELPESITSYLAGEFASE
jgi:uncharacterized protein